MKKKQKNKNKIKQKKQNNKQTNKKKQSSMNHEKDISIFMCRKCEAMPDWLNDFLCFQNLQKSLKYHKNNCDFFSFAPRFLSV